MCCIVVENHAFIGHRLQEALGVHLCAVIVLLYVQQCTVQTMAKLEKVSVPVPGRVQTYV